MKKYNWDLEKIKNFVKESINFTEVLNKLNIPRQGNNGKTLKKILDDNNIDYSHFTGRARNYNTNYKNVEEYLNTKNVKTSRLKEKLLKEQLIENKCSICGLTSWLNKPIVLLLHHIDGNNTNNELSNLQLLCPNCHSQTDNYCGSANSNPIKYYCKDCGKEISKTATYCPVCAAKHSRKIERPSIEQLVEDFKIHNSYKRIGTIYNVRDNTIKKWFIDYGYPDNIKDLRSYITTGKGGA